MQEDWTRSSKDLADRAGLGLSVLCQAFIFLSVGNYVDKPEQKKYFIRAKTYIHIHIN